MNLLGKRCIVGGSGIAGLVSARVASDYFDEVILIDRDDIPGAPETREGVPQGAHFHALLPGGLDVMEALFPGLKETLDGAGALRSKAGRDFVAWFPEGKSYNIGRYDPEPFDGHIAYVQTRALLEHTIRQRVEALPNVTLRYQTIITEPITEGSDVKGVIVSKDGQKESLEAELFIDCTGKICRTMAWLEKLGFAKPQESVIHCDFAYASIFVKPRNWNAFEEVGFFVGGDMNSEHPTRGGGVIKMENGTWIVSLGGRFGDFPPAEIEAFRAWTKTFHNPIVSQLLADVEAITQPATYKFPRSIKRHFENLDAFPEGLLPLGDAICHFNPLYGQGMTSASRQSMGLQSILAKRAEGRRGLAGLALEFFPIAHEETRSPWLMAALADFQMSETKGAFPDHEKAAIDLIVSISEAANKDPVGRQALIQLGSMRMTLAEFVAAKWRDDTVAAES